MDRAGRVVRLILPSFRWSVPAEASFQMPPTIGRPCYGPRAQEWAAEKLRESYRRRYDKSRGSQLGRFASRNLLLIRRGDHPEIDLFTYRAVETFLHPPPRPKQPHEVIRVNFLGRGGPAIQRGPAESTAPSRRAGYLRMPGINEVLVRMLPTHARAERADYDLGEDEEGEED